MKIVYDQKFAGPSEFKLVAPMPEQLKTTTTNLYDGIHSDHGYLDTCDNPLGPP